MKMRRKPIRRRVLGMVLFLCIMTLAFAGLSWAGSLVALRKTALKDSKDLGNEAASASATALLAQMEQNLLKGVKNEARLVDEQMAYYEQYVSDFAYYAHRLYEEPDAYKPKEVLPPDAKNSYTYSLQLGLANEETDKEALEDEIGLLANMVHVWEPVMTNNSDVLYAIYLATESGIFINYDKRSDLTDDYFDYYQSPWYSLARDAGKPVYTDTYEDTFGSSLMITCAAPFYDGSDQFAGVVCMDILINDLCNSILDIDLGQRSYAFLVNADGDIIASPHMRSDGTFENVHDPDCLAYKAANYIMSGSTGVISTSEDLYYAFTPISTANWTLAVHVPANMVTAPAEVIRDDIAIRTDRTARNMQKNITHTASVSLWIFLILICVVVILSNHFSRRLIKPLLALRQDVEEISGGDLDYRATVHTNDEIGDLAHSFNTMTESLSRYIHDLTTVTAEKERIGAELDIAKNIQSSMLPCIFPAFPDRKEFDVYATMDPAKEVGGDFYDFFMVDEAHLAMVVADVSGKGIPAALFMVIGKTLIKDHTVSGKELSEVFTEVNQLLCEGNSEEMFITAFEGVLDLRTGQFDFVNAGHEPPFICRAGSAFELYKTRPGFVLAGMEGMHYRMGSLTLEPGDKIFQYTDGVTEATDIHENMYGMERLAAILKDNSALAPDRILPAVKADVDAFVGEAPQFDDITMLCLEFKEKMKTSDLSELTLDANIENIPVVTDFVNEQLDAYDCSPKVRAQLDVAIDEIFGNIAQYAYVPQTESVTVQVEIKGEPPAMYITFIDKGIPYNPLTNDDPDITLSAKDRSVGGLGIYMVKKSMDDVTYTYKNGQNMLTIRKNL